MQEVPGGWTGTGCLSCDSHVIQCLQLTCNLCGGSGRRVIQYHHGHHRRRRVICRSCNGAGRNMYVLFVCLFRLFVCLFVCFFVCLSIRLIQLRMIPGDLSFPLLQVLDLSWGWACHMFTVSGQKSTQVLHQAHGLLQEQQGGPHCGAHCPP